MNEKKSFKYLRDIGYNLSLLGYLSVVFIGTLLLNVFVYKLIEKHFFRSNLLFGLFILLGIYLGGVLVYRNIKRIRK